MATIYDDESENVNLALYPHDLHCLEIDGERGTVLVAIQELDCGDEFDYDEINYNNRSQQLLNNSHVLQGSQSPKFQKFYFVRMKMMIHVALMMVYIARWKC